MITITIGNNIKTKTIIAEPYETPRKLLDKHNINYTTGTPMLNGEPITDKLDESLSEFELLDNNYLIISIKSIGA